MLVPMTHNATSRQVTFFIVGTVYYAMMFYTPSAYPDGSIHRCTQPLLSFVPSHIHFLHTHTFW